MNAKTALMPIPKADETNILAFDRRDERFNEIHSELHNQWVSAVKAAAATGNTSVRVKFSTVVIGNRSSDITLDLIGSSLRSDAITKVIKAFEEAGYTVKRPTVGNSDTYEIQWA